MPFDYSAETIDALPVDRRMLEDRRDNPVRGRTTRFRLAQQNMLAYTFPSFVPGFAESGINNLPFRQLVERPTLNARREGMHLYGRDFEVAGNAVAKVEGDIFESVQAAVHWNAAARWNGFMTEDEWPAAPRYPRPTIPGAENRQVAVLSLPRRYDWVRLLTPDARTAIQAVRDELGAHGLTLPTSTPDIVIVALPDEYRTDAEWRKPLPDLGLQSQRTLDRAYQLMEGRIEPGEFLLAIALKKSLRSDRLYQPLYEANIMQLLLEGKLGAPQVDFEVHTLEAAGTGAIETYSAASLAAVSSGASNLHRAVRELYEPPDAASVVRRFLAFLNVRMAQVPAV